MAMPILWCALSVGVRVAMPTLAEEGWWQRGEVRRQKGGVVDFDLREGSGGAAFFFLLDFSGFKRFLVLLVKRRIVCEGRNEVCVCVLGKG